MHVNTPTVRVAVVHLRITKQVTKLDVGSTASARVDETPWLVTMSLTAASVGFLVARGAPNGPFVGVPARGQGWL